MHYNTLIIGFSKIFPIKNPFWQDGKEGHGGGWQSRLMFVSLDLRTEVNQA